MDGKQYMIIFGDKEASRNASYILNLSNYKWEQYSQEKKYVVP